jgi:hypothetical protein|tara:strand:+ start:3314 stop:4111 length:798 start_codon:yes stop_codon:yes gene_type:complete
VALEYTGDDGFVASMPQLLHVRANSSYDNIIWSTWFTQNSEESVVSTPGDNSAVVAVNGGGIFGIPERFGTLFHADVNRFCEIGFTGLFAGKVTEREVHDVLKGELHDGTEIPVYRFVEFKRGVGKLPRRYAVILDFETARDACNGYQPFEELKNHPMMIIRAGGVEEEAKHSDCARNRHQTSVMGTLHPFNAIGPEQTQTRVPVLAENDGYVDSEEEDGHLFGYDSEYGMGGDSSIHDTSMINVARYVDVALRDASTSLQNLPF